MAAYLRRHLLLRSTMIASCCWSGAVSAQQLSANTNSTVETVVVTATRMQAQEIKKDAPNLIEVQPYTEIRKLPDVNVAEALQRIPGISLETDTGEGRFINIRGMDADLNGTTFDGVVLTPSNQSSPQGGARAVAFDTFPSELIGGVEVIKTITPDMDASGLGGVINLLPRAPSTSGAPFMDASLGAGIEPLRDRPLWQADFSGGTSFDLGDHAGANRFTAVISYGFYEDWRGIDDLEEGYAVDPFTRDYNLDKKFDNVQYRWYEYHRTRQGLGGLLSFAPDANNSFYVRAIYSGYMEHADKHHLELQNLDNGTYETHSGPVFVSNALPVQTLTDSDENVHNALFVVGGHSIFGAIKADYRVSWTRGMDDFPKNWGAVFTTPNPVALSYNNIASPAFPTFSSSVNLADPAQYTLGPGNPNSQLQNSPSKSFEQEWATAADFTLPLDLRGQDGTFKFGYQVRLRQRGVSADQITYQTPSDVSLAGLTGGSDQIYYDNQYNIGPALNATAIEHLTGLVPYDPVYDSQNNLASFEHDDENVYAGYVQYSMKFGALDVLTGVRYEVTNGAYHANLATTELDKNGNPVVDPITGNALFVFTPDTNKQDYSNFFPSLQTKYTLDDETQFRATFSTAIARPGFNQITAAKTFDYSGLPNINITEGNPTLKATTGDSFDLVAEHYMPFGGIATAGAFYKYFSNYIIPTVDIADNNGGGQTTTNSFADIGDAFAEGAELNYIQKFTFLPEPLDGLGADGNITYVHARGDIRPGERAALPQTSPFNYNAELTYDKGPFGLRVAASYVSANIFAVGGDWSQDVYAQPRFRLDLGSTYDLTENVQFYFDAKNLTNTLLEFTQTDNGFFPIQREFYGPTYFFGVRVQLGDVGSRMQSGQGDDD
jgi:TonB-dependent receptor